MNFRMSHAVNFTQDKPEMSDNNATKCAKGISIRNEIKSKHNSWQIHGGKTNSKEKTDWGIAILLGPQVNDSHAQIFPHTRHFKVQIDSLNNLYEKHVKKQ